MSFTGGIVFVMFLQLLVEFDKKWTIFVVFLDEILCHFAAFAINAEEVDKRCSY